MEDDRIKFQWGEKYIEAEEMTDLGGKYWKWNPDGSITEFKPPELRMKGCAYGITAGGFKFEVKSFYNKFKFKTKEEATNAVKYVNDDGYYALRGIMAKSKGKILTLIATNNDVIENTYFPAKGPSK